MGYPFPPEEASGERTIFPLGGLCPLPRKKMNFSLEMTCFGHSEQYFPSVSLPEKC